MTTTDRDHRLVLVTGPSGAGRTTAIHALEDSGFEAIDNMPLSLVPALVASPPTGRDMALGLDTRNRDFSAAQLIELIDTIGAQEGIKLDVLYLDCRADVLVRRFSETRRRHPMALDDSPNVGIAREFDLLLPVKSRADVLIDTSTLTPHDLRAEVNRWFAPDNGKRMVVSIQSFSYKRGMPRSVDWMFDCRFLRNPHWYPDLRAKDGRDSAVADYVQADPQYDAFMNQITDLMALVLPQHAAEGRSHVSIAFGCTGGQHRSVALAKAMNFRLSDLGLWHTAIRHRELERFSAAPGPVKQQRTKPA